LFNNAQQQAVTTPVMEAKKTAKTATTGMPMIGVRVTEAERLAWEEAARLDGRTLSAWVRRRCNGEKTTAPKRKPPTK